MVRSKRRFLIRRVKQKKKLSSHFCLKKRRSSRPQKKGKVFSLYTSRIKRSILFSIFLSVVVVSPEREREREREREKEKEECKYRERSIFSSRKRRTEEEEQRESERRVITLVSFFVR